MAKHAETHAPQTPKRKQAKHKQEVAKSVASQSQTCCPDDVRDHYLPEKQKQENGSLQEGPANVAPVVRKLIKKHGGTMRLHKLIGVISKKKKLRLGLTGDESMTQVGVANLALRFRGLLRGSVTTCNVHKGKSHHADLRSRI